LIVESRTAVGVKVFSRDSALWGARDFLKAGNWLALLFDQHSGIQGCHSYFLNRFASITTMPELLAKPSGASAVFCFPRRVSFFKAKLELKELNCSPSEFPFAAHKMLEKIIRGSDGLPEWLWAHERWKTQQNFRFHLRYRHKRERLPNPPIKTTKLWIRMPNWLGDVVMSLPLIDAVRRGRPDAEITLIAKPQFKEILNNLNVCDKFIELPYGQGASAFVKFLDNRNEYASVIINLANSLRSDIECALLGAPRRYGLKFEGRVRPFLSHAYRPNSKGSATIHQVQLWENMLKYFGLKEDLDFNPIELKNVRIKGKIGILPGSANQPSKRWSNDNWKELISLILASNSSSQINIYGTIKEGKNINCLMEFFSSHRIKNWCGKTNLWELAHELASCEKVIGNDSGGMHLANLLGANTSVLFGPTDPNVTAPKYNSPQKVIRSRNAEGHLSHDLNDLTADQVFELI